MTKPSNAGRRRGAANRRERGSTLVEMTLICLLVLSMLIGVVDFGQFLYVHQTLSERARAAGIFHDKEEKHSSYGRCADCRHIATCGVCPASIGHIPGNTDPHRVPDLICAFNLVASKYRERFPRPPTVLEALSGRVRAYGPLGETQRRLRARLSRAAVP